MVLKCQTEDKGFGFKFIHGSTRPRFEGDKDYYVTSVVEGGVADRSGQVEIDDTIKRVNDMDVSDKDFEEVYDLLQISVPNLLIHLQKKMDDDRFSKLV